MHWYGGGASGTRTPVSKTGGPNQKPIGSSNLARANNAIGLTPLSEGSTRPPGLPGTVFGNVSPGQTGKHTPLSALPQNPDEVHARPNPPRSHPWGMQGKHFHDGPNGSGGQLTGGLQNPPAAHVNKLTIPADADPNFRRAIVENTTRPKSPPKDGQNVPAEQRQSLPSFDKGIADPTGRKSRPLSSHGSLGPVLPVDDGLGRTTSLPYTSARGSNTTGGGNTHCQPGERRNRHPPVEIRSHKDYDHRRNAKMHSPTDRGNGHSAGAARTSLELQRPK